MFRFSLFEKKVERNTKPEKQNTVPMHDLDTGFKYSVPSSSTVNTIKTTPPVTPNKDSSNNDTYRDYERGITMPW